MAEWESLQIYDVIQNIDDNDIVLPVIQRNLVWDEDKMELLFDSLLKGNSFGGIMALEEEKGGQPLFAIRQFSKDGDMQDADMPPILLRSKMMIIDGQQRLQAFYMGLKGGVNGKKLYFNLFSQDDYEFEFSGQVGDLPRGRKDDGVEVATLWYPVHTLYVQLNEVGGDGHKVTKEIIGTYNILEDTQKDLVYRNVGYFAEAVFKQRVLGISKVRIDKTNPDGERRRMVELFRRLNDGGTRLSALELAASTLKGFDYRLEKFLRREIPEYNDIGIGQDEVVKLLFLLQDNYLKEVTDIEKSDAEFAVNNSPRILKTLEVLRQLLKNAGLYEYYRTGGRSAIPLYFVAYHIFHKRESTEALSTVYINWDANNPDFTNIKTWIYLSLLNGVFGRGKGWVPNRTGVRRLLSVVSQYKGALFPTEAIFSMYEAYPLTFSREISVSQIPHWETNFAFYLMYYGNLTIQGRDIDHVQPKSLLGEAQMPPQNIHWLGNYQLLDEFSNRVGKRAKELKEWINGWEESERQLYLERHLIPKNPKLWGLDQFDELMKERTELIVRKIRDLIPTTITSQPAPQLPLPPMPPVVPTVSGSYPGAAQISKNERNPEAWLTGLADHRGYGDEFRKIVEAARSVGLYARMQNNWWVVMFTPPNDRRYSMIELSTTLEIWVSAQRISQYLNCPPAMVNDKLNFGERLQPEDVSSWIENLRSLFAKE